MSLKKEIFKRIFSNCRDFSSFSFQQLEKFEVRKQHVLEQKSKNFD